MLGVRGACVVPQSANCRIPLADIDGNRRGAGGCPTQVKCVRTDRALDAPSPRLCAKPTCTGTPADAGPVADFKGRSPLGAHPPTIDPSRCPFELVFPVSEAVWQAAPGTGITRTTDRAFRHKLPRMGGPSAHCMPNQLSQILQEPPARPWRRGRGLSMQSRPRGAPAVIDVCRWNATLGILLPIVKTIQHCFRVRGEDSQKTTTKSMLPSCDQYSADGLYMM